jgi:hypothetical protein
VTSHTDNETKGYARFNLKFSRRWVWILETSGTLRRAVSLLYTDDWEVRTASIMRAMEAVRTSETWVYSNETTWRNIPEGSNLQGVCRRQNVQSRCSKWSVLVVLLNLKPTIVVCLNLQRMTKSFGKIIFCRLFNLRLSLNHTLWEEISAEKKKIKTGKC